VGPDPFDVTSFIAAHGHRPVTALPTAARCCRMLDRLALQLAAVTGAQTDRMTRDHGWRLLTVGRLLERLVGMSTVPGLPDTGASMHTWRPGSNCCWTCSTAPSPSAPATSATKTCWR
jgi:hypothetical protein